jgi:hypothetical protein
MIFRIELLVLPLAEIIAAAEAVTYAQKHVLVADLEEVRTGDIFVDVHVPDTVGK